MAKKLILLTMVMVLFCSTGYCKTPFNVDCFFGWDGCYRPMEWTTVNVGIASTLTEPFEGILTISAKQDGMNNLIITHDFVLTPGIRLNIPLVTKFAFATQKCDVRITNLKGKGVWFKSYNLWDYAEQKRKLKAVNENDLLIGLIGQRKFGILKLEDKASCKYGATAGRVFIKDKLPSQIPWDWTGYCGVDLLVLYDADLSRSNASQLKAIEQWVRNGGKLLLILSSNPLTEDNPLRTALPFDIKPSSQYPIPSETTGSLKIGISSSQDVIAWPIVPNDSKLCDFMKISDDTALFATGYCGFGRIGVLSFDPSTLKNKNELDSNKFWISVMSTLLADPKASSLDTQQLPGKGKKQNYNYSQMRYQLHNVQATTTRTIIPKVKIDGNNNHYSQQYGISLAQAASNSVMGYLLNIPEMRPLSIWWVILLLVLLAVLIGPVDYFVLKKLDKQPLTWLTCSGWILLFTVGSYYGVQALRSGDLQYRSVSVTDSIDQGMSTWSATHAGIFAPKSDTYSLDEKMDGQWWSAISPEQREMSMYRSQNTATRNVYCMQEDGANRLHSMPINIWTMQCVLCEEPESDFPIRAKVKTNGDNVTIEISNISGSATEKGYVMLKGNKVFEFGPVGKLSTETFEGKLGRKEMWKQNNKNNHNESLKCTVSILNNEEAFIAKGALTRTKAIRAMMQRGAAVVCVETNTKEPKVKVKNEDCNYTNCKLYRLMVFPEES